MMGLTSWLRKRLTNHVCRAEQRPAAPRFRPRLEALEDRWLPSTLAVTTARDAVNASDGVVSLREAIADANSGDTIVFDKSLVGQTITLANKELAIDKNLTITGPGGKGLTIDGDSRSRVFTVAAGAEVSISGLTLSHGNAWTETTWFGLSGNDGYGGAVLNLGTLSITNCLVCNSYAAKGGGGVTNFGTMTITGSTVSGNRMDPAGGNLSGGRGIYNLGTMTISASIVANNSGGGVFNSGDMTISGSSVTRNTTGAVWGGGIENYSGTLTLIGSTVSGNTAGKSSLGEGRGGGIYNWASASLAVFSSTITSNHADVGADLYNLGDFTEDSSSRIGHVAP